RLWRSALKADPAIVGQSTAVRISASQVDVEGVITGNVDDPNDPAGKVVLHARRGFVWKASIGVDLERIEEVAPGALVQVNGRELAGPLYVVRAGVLDEVSLLSVGADRGAAASIAATAARKESVMDFHEWLKGKGFDPANLSDGQRDTLLKAFQAEQAGLQAAAGNSGSSVPTAAPGSVNAAADAAATGVTVGLDDLLVPVRLKRERQLKIRAAIQRFAEQRPDQLEAIEAAGRVALAEDWTPERLELHLFRDLSIPVDNRPRPAQRGEITDLRVFEAGLCMAGRLGQLEQHFDSRTLELAERRWRRGLGLGELLLTAAKLHGYDGLSFRDVDPLLRAAFPRDRQLRAGSPPSTLDVSGILSNVANKFIVQYFNSADQTWRQVARIRSVTDFKAITSYSLTGDFQYEEVAPGGELKHAVMGEVAYTNKAETFGRMFGIDRRDIINDDLNAFQQVAFRLGRGGILKLNDEFWKKFLSNLSFFTAARGNFADGAETALSVTALEAAETLFALQTDPDGKPIAVMPRILLTPSALKRTALRILNSTEVREVQDTAAGAGTVRTYGTGNTFQGDFIAASTAYLQNSKYTGASARKWYLLAEPSELPVIEVCFLNGIERPTVESAQADFDSLGIKMRGYFDFGVALQEYRGGVALKGEE
ncbi:MAG TPA: hypothetical protein PLQ87_10880, partial [Phycisphaerae bacterium]|nr:hypothetical protein [Phycisphaerae bacterium]